MLQACDISLSLAGEPILHRASIPVRPGELHVLLGPNGAGKSCLIKLLAGEHRPSGGRVELDGRCLSDWRPGDLARRRAVLPQSSELRFAFTVAEVVALGLLPHGIGDARRASRIIDRALQATGIAGLAPRAYTRLSGGERARVHLSRVLAQIWGAQQAGAPQYLLLDEPTANLDLAFQHECLSLARELADQGLGVLAALHDPNLAGTYAHRVSMIRRGHLIASGSPWTVMTAESLSTLYEVPIRLAAVTGSSVPIVQVRPRPWSTPSPR